MAIEAMSSCWGPDFPVDAQGLSAQTVRVVALAVADVVNDTHGWRFYGRRKSVAAKVCCDPDTVGDVFAHLVEEGVMSVVEAPPGKPVEYEWLWGRRDLETHGDPPHPLRSSTVGGAVTSPHQKTNRDQVEPPPQPPASGGRTRDDEPLAAEQRAADFQALWEAYPKRTHRFPAERAWVKNLAQIPTLDVLLEAVEAMIVELQRSHPGVDWRRFAPRLNAWITERRWRDLEGRKIEVASASTARTCFACGVNAPGPDTCRGVDAGVLGSVDECPHRGSS
jgi:hypothetical protein